MKTVDIQKAKELLLDGGVVAIPTETVYGLAGWIYSEAGLKKIFSTKERPFFDPLIVHVDTIEKAKSLTSEWTQIHQVLASSCWPGPLTLIAKKLDSVNPLISSGLDSVGLRCPRHPLTLELLSLIDGGLAAPSANKFGKTSPSQAKHVFEEFGDSVSILDGGPCEVGIESTVVGIEEGKVLIYRPGFYTAPMLQEILLKHRLNNEVSYAQSPVAPGQLKHHYMPRIPLVITDVDFNWSQSQAKIQDILKSTFSNPVNWKLPSSAHEASRVLYEDLRSFDQKGYDLILIAKEAHHESEEWKGVWNRLEKAQTITF